MIENYIVFMFWMGILSVIVRAFNIMEDHPRTRKTVNIGTDLFALLVSIGMLAWVSYIKFNMMG